MKTIFGTKSSRATIALLSGAFACLVQSANAAYEFRRGTELTGDTATRNFSDISNWSTARAAYNIDTATYGNAAYSNVVANTGSWVGDYNKEKNTTTAETGVTSLGSKITQEIYLGPNSAYNGNDAVGVNGNDGFMVLDMDVQTYRWFVGYYGNTNPIYPNTALGIKGDKTLTIDSSRDAKSDTTESVCLTTRYASNNFTVAVDLDIMSTTNTSGADMKNNFVLSSVYDTTFALGKTITISNDKTPMYSGTKAASAATYLQLDACAMASASDVTGKIYVASKVISSSIIAVRTTSGTIGWSNMTSQAQAASVQFCGNVTNEIEGLGLWRYATVDLNMQGGAFLMQGGRTIMMRVGNVLNFKGENQLINTNISVSSDASTDFARTFYVNLEGHSVGMVKDEANLNMLSINQLRFDKSTNAATVLNLDFGVNNVAQVFAFGIGIDNNTAYDDVFNVRNFDITKDRFITETLLDEAWIGTIEKDGMLLFDGYTHEDGYYIVADLIDDTNDVFNGMYEYKITAIPEPAMFAAVLGALALGLAYRRSRK